LAGGLRFMGTWNATTNSPTLASGGGEADSGTTTGTATNKLIQSSQNLQVQLLMVTSSKSSKWSNSSCYKCR
jgi:hypothetical protein